MTHAVKVTGRRRALIAAFLLLGSLAGCAPRAGSWMELEGRPPAGGPRTRAERTLYRETSSYGDVVAFVDSLRSLGAPLAFGSIGRTTEGREIPYIIASRPRVTTPGEARATGKPIVYVQGNIHAGEVEGKEAVLALVRDLALAPGANVLDSIVLIAVPIYNADGNERWGPQDRQRTEQNGPALVGQRPNAMGLDLNRDYIKAEAPETRASLAMWNAWDPDIFVDLHTTDGSYHGYALTYAPSLSPAAPLGDYTRELLAELRRRMRTREGYETFDYGNFEDPGGREVSTDTVHAGWYTYDARPRFGTNYYGLRNRIAILSEAFSHDPFERRVRATYAFTRQLLSLVAERSAEIRIRENAVERLGRQGYGGRPDSVPLRSVLPSASTPQPVVYEILARTGDSVRTQPGVPRGIRRTGELRTRAMPVFDRFVPALTRRSPYVYVISGRDSATLQLLRLHGLVTQRIPDAPLLATLEEFRIDSVGHATRPFQGHLEARPFGSWVPATTAVDDPWIVFAAITRNRLLMTLLDPESEDGLAVWDLFGAKLAPGIYPVRRSSSWLKIRATEPP